MGCYYISKQHPSVLTVLLPLTHPLPYYTYARTLIHAATHVRRPRSATSFLLWQISRSAYFCISRMWNHDSKTIFNTHVELIIISEHNSVIFGKYKYRYSKQRNYNRTSLNNKLKQRCHSTFDMIYSARQPRGAIVGDVLTCSSG